MGQLMATVHRPLSLVSVRLYCPLPLQVPWDRIKAQAQVEETLNVIRNKTKVSLWMPELTKSKIR